MLAVSTVASMVCKLVVLLAGRLAMSTAAKKGETKGVIMVA